MSETASDRLEAHMTAGNAVELRKALEDAARSIREHVPDERCAFATVAQDVSDPERRAVAGIAHAELLERAAAALAPKPLPEERFRCVNCKRTYPSEPAQCQYCRGRTFAEISPAKTKPLPPTDDVRARLIEYVQGQCNRYLNGHCSTRRCLVRGGWSQVNGPPDFETATCEEHEIFLALSAQSSPPPSSGEAEAVARARAEAFEDAANWHDELAAKHAALQASAERVGGERPIKVRVGPGRMIASHDTLRKFHEEAAAHFRTLSPKADESEPRHD